METSLSPIWNNIHILSKNIVPTVNICQLVDFFQTKIKHLNVCEIYLQDSKHTW